MPYFQLEIYTILVIEIHDMLDMFCTLIVLTFTANQQKVPPPPPGC